MLELSNGQTYNKQARKWQMGMRFHEKFQTSQCLGQEDSIVSEASGKGVFSQHVN
jgi:hypothetical protein